MKILLIFIGVVFCRISLLANNDSTTVNSTLISAIVYRTGAELVHSAQAYLNQGSNWLSIEDISNNIDLNSIRVSCADYISLQSVEFSKQYLKPPKSSIWSEKLADSIGLIRKDLDRVEVLIRSDNEMLDLLRANKELRGTQTGLSVSELMKMMDYYKQKSVELLNEIWLLNTKHSRLSLLIENLQQEKQEEEKKNAKTSGRLYLQLLSTQSGEVDFTISYLTPTAYWNPFYELRLDNINNPLKLQYKAKLVQTSGIDWKKIKLSLSTSIPDQDADAPILNTWFLQYAIPLTDLEKPALPQVSFNNGNAKKYAANDMALNYRSAQLSDQVDVKENMLSVIFSIDLPYDVPSNGKEQQVVLKEYMVPATFRYYAIPKLNQTAYLLAEIPGWGKFNLLRGEASLIVEGTFTGKTAIDPNSTLDTLNLSLGMDKRIVVEREKITDFSSVKFLGSNKKQVFTYEITVKNNKKEIVPMLLEDQYPISTNKEIESELIDAAGATINEETGKLTWKLQLAPGESRKYRVSYSIKYPRDKTINF